MDLFRKYQHLLHRTSFGMGPRSISGKMPSSVEEMVESIFMERSKSVQPEPTLLGQPVLTQSTFLNADRAANQMKEEDDRDKLRLLRSQWIYSMADEDGGAFTEKMTLFWHGHLACQCNTSQTAASYLQTLRKHALGNMRDLVLAIAKEPAMLRFLNNQQNRKGHPNENFARELLELFTIGEGNYSENDVKESARAFTGWAARKGRFFVRPAFHDYGQKEFLGARGKLDGSDVVRIIFEQRLTAQFLAKKLYRYFVNEEIDSAHVNELADHIFQQDYDTTSTMKFLFTRPWFYEERNVGTKIKSPVDLIAQIVRLFTIRFKDPDALTFLQRGLGQMLFNPPNVAGWPGGRSWINNATLMLRLNLSTFLLDGRRFDHATATPLKAMEASKPIQILQMDHDLAPLLENFINFRYDQQEEELKRVLLATKKSPELSALRDRRSTMSYPQILVRRIASLPEFQMC